MRIHSQTEFKPDLILAFRALMLETLEYGYHTFFLTTVSPGLHEVMLQLFEYGVSCDAWMSKVQCTCKSLMMCSASGVFMGSS